MVLLHLDFPRDFILWYLITPYLARNHVNVQSLFAPALLAPTRAVRPSVRSPVRVLGPNAKNGYKDFTVSYEVTGIYSGPGSPYLIKAGVPVNHVNVLARVVEDHGPCSVTRRPAIAS